MGIIKIYQSVISRLKISIKMKKIKYRKTMKIRIICLHLGYKIKILAALPIIHKAK
jgi:hypothetical protein